MTRELEQKVTNILKSIKTKPEQSVEIFLLAEAAWNFGDIAAYQSLMTLLRKFFPAHKINEPSFLSKSPSGAFPDIDRE